MKLSVVDLGKEHLRYISLCTHIDDESSDSLSAASIRLEWLKDQTEKKRIFTKVAINEDNELCGFIHMVPIESPISGMIGKDMMVIPCLTLNYKLVYQNVRGTGIGKMLVEASESEAKEKHYKGLAVYAYNVEPRWIMPSGFFLKLGFRKVTDEPNIWVKKWAQVENPRSPTRHYKYSPVLGKVTLDYFWTPFCFTVCKELHNIRQVASEFGDRVQLNEHRVDNPETYRRYGMTRDLFINGKPKGWGYEAPKKELRKEIRNILGEER